jgi:Uma2 family endonuclease
MATTSTRDPTVSSRNGDQCVEMHDVDWKGYLTMLRLRGERGVPKMIYLDRSLWLVSPSLPHERIKVRLGHFVIELLVALDLPYCETAQTTFRRRRHRAGVEGDQTYYIANEVRVRGKAKLNLRLDPPPDLAIEAVYSHDACAALEVYRRLKVPEVWVCNESGLRIFVQQSNGKYALASGSLAFPFLTADAIFEWVDRARSMPDLEWMKTLRHWLTTELVPKIGTSPSAEI